MDALVTINVEQRSDDLTLNVNNGQKWKNELNFNWKLKTILLLNCSYYFQFQYLSESTIFGIVDFLLNVNDHHDFHSMFNI